jgi:hypothetical protein
MAPRLGACAAAGAASCASAVAPIYNSPKPSIKLKNLGVMFYLLEKATQAYHQGGSTTAAARRFRRAAVAVPLDAFCTSAFYRVKLFLLTEVAATAIILEVACGAVLVLVRSAALNGRFRHLCRLVEAIGCVLRRQTASHSR